LKNVSSIKLIDNIILFFTVVFLASLTNSIFVNQLGYYGALIFIVIKSSILKENAFKKNGLEIFFILFISAEILSTIFSENLPQSFNNLLKRVLLLPVVYIIIASADSKEKTKLFFKIYISFAVISAAIYLFNSYQYFITGLFSITGSGPSVFQYPITTSELLSFTVIFLFAFLINEKGSYKNKIIILLGFIISAAALAATYKRTGWLGVAAGIVFILLIRKKYLYLVPVVLALVYLVFSAKNGSSVYIYNYDSNIYSESSSFDTEGRASDILPDNGGKYYLSDYENGLITFSGNKIINKLELPEPIVKLLKWNDSLYCAALIDTRFILLNKNINGQFETDAELLSPGYTRDYKIRNNYLYVLDSDSGLTVFDADKKGTRFPQINNNVLLEIDSLRMVLVTTDRKLKIYKLNNYLPAEIIDSPPIEGNLNFIKLFNNELLFSDKSGIKKYDFSSQKTLDIKYAGDEKIYNLYQEEQKLFAVTANGTIYDIDKHIIDSLKIISKIEAGFIPQSISYEGNNLFLTKVKRSRLASIFDPYLPSNTVRISLWTAGWEIFKDNPIFGVGDIDLAGLYIKYKSKYDKEIQGHLHNNYVHLLATLGAFGFIIVALLLLKIFIENIKIFNSLKNIPFASSFSLGAIGCFVSFLVAGLTEWNFGDHEIITMIWFITGLNFAFYFQYKEKHKA